MDTSIVKFNVADSAIAEMGQKYLPLVINGIDDKVGFQMVHAARMEVKRTRLDVEKTRKELNGDAVRFTRAVDAEARRIKAMLEPIESHLEGQELAVINEKERLKKIEEQRLDNLAQSRVDMIAVEGVQLGFMVARSMTSEEFAAALRIATEQRAALEAQRKKAQEEAAREAERIDAERKAEEERLAEQRRKDAEIRAAMQKAHEEAQAEIVAQRRKIEEERKALEKEIRKIEAQKAEKARQEELERWAKEAAEKAMLEAQEKAKAESEARAKAEAEAEAERQRLEAQRPDVIKLRDFAMKLHGLEIVGLKTEAGINLSKEVYKRIFSLERWLLKQIVGLEGGDADA
jgi:hypothetical protein